MRDEAQTSDEKLHGYLFDPCNRGAIDKAEWVGATLLMVLRQWSSVQFRQVRCFLREKSMAV